MMPCEAVKREIILKIREYDGTKKIKGAKLGDPFGLSDETIRKTIINPYRSKPFTYEIASDNYGYWWTNDWRDLVATIKHMKGRIGTMLNACDGLEEAILRLKQAEQQRDERLREEQLRQIAIQGNFF